MDEFKNFYGNLEVDYSIVWDDIPSLCSRIHPSGLTDEIEKAVADGIFTI